jgi:hypothetical protein
MATFFNRFRRSPADTGVNAAPASPEAQVTELPATTDFEKHDQEKHIIEASGPEKLDPDAGVSKGTLPDDDSIEDLPADVRELPKIVRSIVSLDDDPNAPTLSFRYFVLCFIFIPPGAILYQMGVRNPGVQSVCWGSRSTTQVVFRKAPAGFVLLYSTLLMSLPLTLYPHL